MAHLLRSAVAADADATAAGAASFFILLLLLLLCFLLPYVAFKFYLLIIVSIYSYLTRDKFFVVSFCNYELDLAWVKLIRPVFPMQDNEICVSDAG